jgi:hypothetical protein
MALAIITGAVTIDGIRYVVQTDIEVPDPATSEQEEEGNASH